MGSASPSCPSMARSCLGQAAPPAGWGCSLQSRAGGSGDKVARSQWQDPVAETPYPASPLASATMKQMPWAWQKSPT